jgi:signal transduction histidine kinase
MSNPVMPSRLQRLVSVWKNLTASLPLEDTLQSLAEAGAAVLESEACSILLYDEAQHTLRFVAAPPEQLAVMKNLGVPVERSVAGWVYTHARPALINQAGDDERIFRVVDREVSEATRSLLAVPIAYRGKTIGVFEATNRIDGAFNDDDLALLETLAAQAAVIIRGERQVEETRGVNRALLRNEKIRRDRQALLAQELRDAAQSIIDAVDSANHREPQAIAREVPWVLADPVAYPGADAILDACVDLQRMAAQMDELQKADGLWGGLRYQRASVPALVERVTAVFRQQAVHRDISLKVDVPRGLECVCDPGLLALALYNLMENACKFTNQGGWVRVRAEALPGFTKFALIDRGMGISAKEQAVIFEPFAQGFGVAERYGGAGVGLALAKEIIERHGGEIWVESEEGQGSTFSFLLPEHE